MKERILSILVLLLTVGLAGAQQMAPRDTAEVELGGKRVAIEYGQPSLGDRTFESLMSNLPPDRMWRAGSEQVTSLTAEGDILVGGQKVPAGKYSLYVHVAEEGPYHLVLNEVVGQPLGDIWKAAPPEIAQEPWPHFAYSKEIGDREVARVPLEQAATEPRVDRFTIELQSGVGGSARLALSWGEQTWWTSVAAAGLPEGSHGK